ncbi:hypothetical protein J6590_085642 [Homalodisca vitripennis]|nr:hypothetical protein J6590_085642 [Homalodisca vitripennis]
MVGLHIDGGASRVFGAPLTKERNILSQLLPIPEMMAEGSIPFKIYLRCKTHIPFSVLKYLSESK